MPIRFRDFVYLVCFVLLLYSTLDFFLFPKKVISGEKQHKRTQLLLLKIGRLEPTPGYPQTRLLRTFFGSAKQCLCFHFIHLCPYIYMYIYKWFVWGEWCLSKWDVDSQTHCSNNKSNRIVNVLGFIILKIDLLILIKFYF